MMRYRYAIFNFGVNYCVPCSLTFYFYGHKTAITVNWNEVYVYHKRSALQITTQATAQVVIANSQNRENTQNTKIQNTTGGERKRQYSVSHRSCYVLLTFMTGLIVPASSFLSHMLTCSFRMNFLSGMLVFQVRNITQSVWEQHTTNATWTLMSSQSQFSVSIY